MNKAKEFDIKQLEKQSELIHNNLKTGKLTEKERDLFNLRYMRYSIRYGSLWYRSGMIKTLDRAIKRLEA